MVSVSGENKYSILSFWDTAIEKDFIWVSNVTFNSLFKICRESKKSQFITRFFGEREIGGLHKQILIYGDTLIFIPELGKQVALFDKMTKKMRYISIILQDSIEEEVKAAGAVIYDDELWIFPQYLSQDVIVIDLRTEKVRHYDILRSFLKKQHIQTKRPAFAIPIFRGDETWIPIKDTRYMIRFKIRTQEISLYALPDEKCRINSISKGKEKIWITFVNELKIMSFHMEEGIKEVCIDAAWDGKMVPFSRVIELEEDQLLILPAHTENIVLLENKRTIELPYPENFYWINDFKLNWSRFGEWKDIGEEIWIYPSVGNMMLIYHKGEKRLSGIVFRTPEKWDDNYVRSQMLRPNIIRDKIWNRLKETYVTYERDEFNIEDFLKYLTSQEEKKRKHRSEGQLCGEVIYKNLIG